MYMPINMEYFIEIHLENLKIASRLVGNYNKEAKKLTKRRLELAACV